MYAQLETLMIHLLEQPFAIVMILMVVAFVYMFWKSEDLDWTDMITNKGSKTVSLTKMLQLVGGVIGSWIMVKTTLQGKLTYELFAIYLTYVGAIEGWSKFVAAKYGFSPPGTVVETQTTSTTTIPAPPAPVQTQTTVSETTTPQ